jgi:hypothetical protein
MQHLRFEDASGSRADGSRAALSSASLRAGRAAYHLVEQQLADVEGMMQA